MSQQYTPLAGGQTIKDSRQVINNNIDAVASCFSGTAFPTANLSLGMLCYRSDEGKLYQLTDLANRRWLVVRDLNINPLTEMHFRGAVDGANLDTVTATGIYMVTYPTWAATMLVFNAPMGSTGPVQMLIGYGENGALTIRNYTDNNRWSPWRTIWTSGTDGAGTGLDADLLDGLQASDFLRVINSSLVTVETDWNAVPVGVCAVANGGGANSPAATLGAYPYGVVLTMKAEIERGMCQIYIPHHSNGKYSMYVRAGWVGASPPWNPWRAVVTSEQLTWENITGKPNTIAGYGITDAAKKATVSTAAPSGGVDGDVWYQV